MRKVLEDVSRPDAFGVRATRGRLLKKKNSFPGFLLKAMRAKKEKKKKKNQHFRQNSDEKFVKDSSKIRHNVTDKFVTFVILAGKLNSSAS